MPRKEETAFQKKENRKSGILTTEDKPLEWEQQWSHSLRPCDTSASYLHTSMSLEEAACLTRQTQRHAYMQPGSSVAQCSSGGEKPNIP